MRLLGIDYGHRKVGIAISDEAGAFAFPYKVLKTSSKLIEEVVQICVTEKIKKIIIGESVDLSGQPNLIMKDILYFKKELEKKSGLPIEMEKEFFTSREAKRIIDEKQTDLETDARAASIILRSYIEKKKNLDYN